MGAGADTEPRFCTASVNHLTDRDRRDVLQAIEENGGEARISYLLAATRHGQTRIRNVLREFYDQGCLEVTRTDNGRVKAVKLTDTATIAPEKTGITDENPGV